MTSLQIVIHCHRQGSWATPDLSEMSIQGNMCMFATLEKMFIPSSHSIAWCRGNSRMNEKTCFTMRSTPNSIHSPLIINDWNRNDKLCVSFLCYQLACLLKESTNASINYTNGEFMKHFPVSFSCSISWNICMEHFHAAFLFHDNTFELSTNKCKHAWNPRPTSYPWEKWCWI